MANNVNNVRKFGQDSEQESTGRDAAAFIRLHRVKEDGTRGQRRAFIALDRNNEEDMYIAENLVKAKKLAEQTGDTDVLSQALNQVFSNMIIEIDDLISPKPEVVPTKRYDFSFLG